MRDKFTSELIQRQVAVVATGWTQVVTTMGGSDLAGRRDVVRSYVESYVALERIRRRADRMQGTFERWLSRVTLAERRGEPHLAELARRRALRAAELDAELRRIYRLMEQDVAALRELALDP